MILLVVFYVWQNVEVMKINLEYQRKSYQEISFLKEHDRLIYELEKLRKMEIIEAFALGNDYRPVTRGDLELDYSSGGKEK